MLKYMGIGSGLPFWYRPDYVFLARVHREHKGIVDSWAQQEVNNQMPPYKHHKLAQNILFYLKKLMWLQSNKTIQARIRL